MFALRRKNSLMTGSFQFTQQTGWVVTDYLQKLFTTDENQFIQNDYFKFNGQTGGFGAMFTQQLWKKFTTKNEVPV
jgi:hypothetical protein